MPELPEVEIIRRYLAGNIVGKTVGTVESLLPRMWRNTTAAVASDILTNQTIESVGRRGKYLVFTWSPSGAVLLVHLKLTGRLIYRPEPSVERFDRILFHFTDGTMLAYGDIRTLGALYCFPDRKAIDVKAYLAMGVEPLSTGFTAKKFSELVKRSSQPIKPFLLAQTFVAGLGNIYVDEALAAAGIKLFGGVSGDADEAVEAFINETLEYNPDVKCSHHEHNHGEGHTCGEHGCGSHSCH